MTIQASTAVRNAILDAFESTTGTGAILKFYSGAQPTNCAAAASGTVLATATLPSDWMGAASGGVKALSGSWQDASADATGTVGHYRIYDSTGTTCHMQGSVTATGGGGDMTIDNTSVAAGQQINIVTFSLTAAMA